MSDGVTRFVSWALFAVGAMLTLLCGSCTLVFGGGAIAGLLGGDDAGLAGFILALALIVGGIPTAGGVVLLIQGWKSVNANRPRPDLFD